jgi:hypothetical protein
MLLGDLGEVFSGLVGEVINIQFIWLLGFLLSVQQLAFIIERTMIAKMFLMEGNLECREANTFLDVLEIIIGCCLNPIITYT